MPVTTSRDRRAAAVPTSIVVGTVATYALGYLAGVPALVPVLNVLPAFPAMVASLRRGDARQAVIRMLIWAATMGVCATGLSYVNPVYTGDLFVNGDRYRAEMVEWVLTGRGTESQPRAFLPLHAAHAAIFMALSLVSASVLSLVMGAVLMNYMGHFVGALGSLSQEPLLTMILAWHPWSVVRIVSFVTLGVVLAGPLLSRVAGFPFRLVDHRRLLALAATGLLLDVLLKAILAPTWQRLLRSLVGG
jgi:hypothetical protein